MGVGLGLVGGEGNAHAALGVFAQFLELPLAAPASMDLRFHHPDRTGQRVDGSVDVIGGEDRRTV